MILSGKSALKHFIAIATLNKSLIVPPDCIYFVVRWIKSPLKLPSVQVLYVTAYIEYVYMDVCMLEITVNHRCFFLKFISSIIPVKPAHICLHADALFSLCEYIERLEINE